MLSGMNICTLQHLFDSFGIYTDIQTAILSCFSLQPHSHYPSIYVGFYRLCHLDLKGIKLLFGSRNVDWPF